MKKLHRIVLRESAGPLQGRSCQRQEVYELVVVPYLRMMQVCLGVLPFTGPLQRLVIHTFVDYNPVEGYKILGGNACRIEL